VSSGAARRAAEALPVAVRVLDAIGGACKRATIAGSLRRGAGMVSDIELVCEPRVGRDLFGEPNGDCELAARLEELRASGAVRWRDETHPPNRDWHAARRMWALVVEPEGIPLDVFAVRPPAQWGAILAIRTGPAEYSRRLVTTCRERGFRCTEGRLVDASGHDVWTPEERDFIATCGLPWAEPEARS
jgi:DNA polymerase/3'-5' exonuclease PolX